MSQTLAARDEAGDAGRRGEGRLGWQRRAVVDLDRQAVRVLTSDETEHAAFGEQRRIAVANRDAALCQPPRDRVQFGRSGHLEAQIGDIVGLARLERDAPGLLVQPEPRRAGRWLSRHHAQHVGREHAPGVLILHLEAEIAQRLDAHGVSLAWPGAPYLAARPPPAAARPTPRTPTPVSRITTLPVAGRLSRREARNRKPPA